MANELTAIEALYGETSAIQIVVQRLVAQMAMQSGHDLKAVLRAEHGQASAELAQMDLLSARPEFADAVRAHAQTVLDDMYTVAASSTLGSTGGKE